MFSSTIDDGPSNLEQSLTLLTEIKKLGFSKIIATPHTYPGLYNNTNESITESFKKLKSKNQIIELDYASEYLLDSSIVKKSESNSLLTLYENYLLVELSFISPPIGLFDMLFKLRLNGYIPILAHPERYIFFYNNFDKYKKMKDMGCKFQINLLSLTGYYGDNVKKISDKLLKNKMIDFFGSDIHSLHHLKQFGNKILVKNYELIEKLMINQIEVFRT